jgi:hypothetical protein
MDAPLFAGNVDTTVKHVVYQPGTDYFRVFDSLPPPIREAVREAPFDYDILAIRDDWNNNSYFMSAHQYASNMRQFFRNDVMRDSITKLEPRGEYRLKRRNKRENPSAAIQRIPSNRWPAY